MNEPLSDRRVVVVTGGSDGIGAAAARVLARRGDRVVLVGRSPGKTRSVAAEIGAENNYVADFAHLGQVRELAAGLARQYPRIDVLVNNAGLIAGAQRTVTADGHELTFQVNHLAPFLLTVLLRGPLGAARASVITTSSRAGTARDARVNPADRTWLTAMTGCARTRRASWRMCCSPVSSPGAGNPWGSVPLPCTRAWSGHNGAGRGPGRSGRYEFTPAPGHALT